MIKKLFFWMFLLAGIMTWHACKDKKNNGSGGDDNGGGGITKIELAVSPWPCYGQNPRLSFSSPYAGPSSAPSQKWKVNVAKGVLLHSLVIGPDGTLYVNSRRSLIAVNPSDGSVKWTYDAKMELSEAPVVDKNNVVYITGIEYGLQYNTYGEVVAVKGDSGTVKWRFNSGDSVSGGYIAAPAIGYEGYLYVAENGPKKLYALNGKGQKAWEYSSPYPIKGMPAIGADSTLYITAYSVADSKGSLIALRPGGTEKWKVDFSASSATQPAVSPAGNIYISYGAKMYCYKATGTLKWSLIIQSGVAASRLSVGSTESVYFTDNNSQPSVIAMNDGIQEFTNPYLNGNITADNNKNIFVQSNSTLFAHDVSTKTTIWTYSLAPNTAEGNTAYAVIDKNGVIYVTTEQGQLIALQ